MSSRRDFPVRPNLQLDGWQPALNADPYGLFSYTRNHLWETYLQPNSPTWDRLPEFLSRVHKASAEEILDRFMRYTARSGMTKEEANLRLIDRIDRELAEFRK